MLLLAPPFASATPLPAPATAEPVITSLQPRGGPVLGDTTVTVRGSNLQGTQACRFGKGPAQPATVQIEVKPSPPVLCTTPRRNFSAIPEAELGGSDEMVSLSTWAGTWNTASLSAASVSNAFVLGGRLTFRFYHTRTLGVEPNVGQPGATVKVYASGLADYPFVPQEGRCRFGARGASVPVLKVTSEYVTCRAPPAAEPQPASVDVLLALNGQDFVAADHGDGRFEYAEPGAHAPVGRPVVMLHDVARGPSSLSRLGAILNELSPATQVYVPELFGAGTATPRGSLLLHLDVQQRRLCELLTQRQEAWGLGGGFTLLGVGQGGLLARAHVQRGCAGGPEVRTLVSILAPQQGVMRAPADQGEMVRLLDGLSMDDPYAAEAQAKVSYAGYWHDPAQPERYRAASSLLADLNAETTPGAEYAARLRALDAFVLVGSSRDEYLVPWQSAFFGFYADSAAAPPGDVVLLRDSSGYQQDRLGLRTLDERGALPVLDAKCLHYDFEAMPASLQLFVKSALLPLLTKGGGVGGVPVSELTSE